MAGQRQGDSTGVVPRALVATGVLFATSIVLEWALFVRPSDANPAGFYAGVVTNLPFVLGFVYAGYRLDRGEVPPDRFRRIVGWSVSGCATFLLVNLVLIAAFPPVGPVAVYAWLRWAAVIGGAVGLLIGVIEARAIERERAAERAAARAEHASEQRELLEYLNDLLRHEVLNSANVIGGYADRIERDGDGSVADHAAVIRRHSDTMTTIVRDVRVLIDATRADDQFVPVDLSAMLDRELATLRETHPEADVEATVPEDVYVYADDLLRRAVANLLANAVDRHEAGAPSVEVTVDPGPDAVRVSIADDGPGVPDSRRESVFERTGDRATGHGLGLYLVETLVERYGGTVELAEAGDSGSTFEVELPRAPVPEDESDPPVDEPAATG